MINKVEHLEMEQQEQNGLKQTRTLYMIQHIQQQNRYHIIQVVLILAYTKLDIHLMDGTQQQQVEQNYLIKMVS